MPRAKFVDHRYGIQRRELELYGRKLTMLPVKIALFSNLVKLDIACNNLVELDGSILPASLETLYCNNNRLRTIKNLKVGLLELYCWGNELEDLEGLPYTLVKLRCCDNQIARMDYLPISLRSLYCIRNLLTRLDFLPIGLKVLVCYGNPLEEMRNVSPYLCEVIMPPELLGLTYYQSLQQLSEFEKRHLVELPDSIVEINGMDAKIS